MKRLVLAITLTVAALSFIGCPPEEEEEKFHVYYFGEGNTGGEVPVDLNEYVSGDTAAVLGSGSLFKDGYAFRGWVRSINPYYLYAVGETFEINYGSVRFYAAWSKTQPFIYEEDAVVPGGITITGYTPDPSFYNENIRLAPLPDSVASERTAFQINADIAPYYAYSSQIVIPDSLNGKPVTGIAPNAFSGNYIISCTLPSGLIHIDENAFKDCNLDSIELPDSLTSIGEAAFRYNRISSLTIGASLTTISALAFEGNYLSNLTLPSNITKIEQAAFYDNPITEITIGDDVEIEGTGSALGNYGAAFKECYEAKERAAGTYMMRSSVWKKVAVE